jgi:hypothetical protein
LGLFAFITGNFLSLLVQPSFFAFSWCDEANTFFLLGQKSDFPGPHGQSRGYGINAEERSEQLRQQVPDAENFIWAIDRREVAESVAAGQSGDLNKTEERDAKLHVRCLVRAGGEKSFFDGWIPHAILGARWGSLGVHPPSHTTDT